MIDRKTFLALVFIVSVLQSFSQPYKVKWGTLQKKSGRLISIIPRTGDDFFALRWTGGLLLGSVQLSKHDHLTLTATGKIVMKVENSMASFEGVTCVDNHLMVFLSDKNEGKHLFYMQEYDENIEAKGEPTKLGEYEIPKGRTKGSYDIIHSKDRQFFGIIWEYYDKAEDRSKYGFQIFNNEIATVSAGSYLLPYDPKDASIYSHHLSNTGDYFIAILEYSKSEEKKIFNKYLQYKAFHITHVTPDDLEDFTLDLNGKRVEAMTMESDNNHIFTITGIYGEEKKTGITGVFYLRAVFDKKEIVDQGFEEFKTDFIIQDWSERQKERAEKRAASGRGGEPQLYNYQMREANIMKDGSIVGSIEQYYVVTTTYRNPQTGATNTTYTYYYNDIIAFKVGVEGGFDWLKKIDKQQVSTNDNGTYSSYARFIDNGKLCFIFNDNINNYDVNGQFIKTDGIYPANFSKRKNAVGIVALDLETGDIKRQTFFNAKEIEALVVPKLFITDYTTKQLTLYAVYGKKEKFGTLNFKD